MTIGIVIIILGVVSLGLSLLSLYMYHSVLDGSAQLYNRLHQRAFVFLIIGIAILVIGILCVVINLKQKN